MKRRFAFAFYMFLLSGLNAPSALAVTALPGTSERIADNEVIVNIPNAGGKTPFKITCGKNGNPDAGLLDLLGDDRAAIQQELSDSNSKDVQAALEKMPLQKQIIDSKEADMTVLREMNESRRMQVEDLKNEKERIWSSIDDVSEKLKDSPSLLAKIFLNMQKAELISQKAELEKRAAAIEAEQDAINGEWSDLEESVYQNKKDIAKAFKSPETLSLEQELAINEAHEQKARNFCYMEKYGTKAPSPEKVYDYSPPLLPIPENPPMRKRGDPATRAAIQSLEAARQAAPALRTDPANPSQRGNALIRKAVNPCFAPAVPES